MADATAAPPAPARTGAVALFRVVLWAHALLVVVQPVAAGAMLQASTVGRAVHGGVAGVLLLVAMVQIPVAVLAWRPGRWPPWPAAVSVLLFAVETTQHTLGFAGELAIHVPLGIAIVVTVVGMALWSLRSRRR